MDTLSSPIPNLQVPKPFNTNHHLHHRKATHFSHHHLPSSSTKTTTSSLSTLLPQKDNFTPLLTYQPQKRSPSPTSTTSLSSRKPPPPRPSIHRKAASGYAAALLDISQSNNTILKVEKDVRRLLKVVFRSNNAQVREFLKNDLVEENAKGKVLKNFMLKGKFEGNLVGLINMLVDKGNSVDLIKEVLEEFTSIFHQLTIGVAHTQASTLAMSKTI